MLHEMRRQFRDLLADIGFAARYPPRDSEGGGDDEDSPQRDINLIRAVMCAGLNPHVGEFMWRGGRGLQRGSCCHKGGDVSCHDTRSGVKGTCITSSNAI